MQNSFSYERFRTQTRFQTEAQENSEMAYSKGKYEKLAAASICSLPNTQNLDNSRCCWKEDSKAMYKDL